MTAKQIIDMALAHQGMSKALLATKLGMSPQNLSKRINTGRFTPEEWNEIAVALGACSAGIHIYFDDGTIV